MGTTKEDLKNYAITQGYECWDEEELSKFPLFTAEPVTRSKKLVFKIPGKTVQDMFFIASDWFSTKAYAGNTFSGLYAKANPKIKDDITIFRREWFDFLNLKKPVLTGDRFLDKNLTIYSRRDVEWKKIIERGLVKRFIDLFEITGPLKIVARENDWQFVPDFSSSRMVGIETNYWINDTEKLGLFIQEGGILLQDLIERGL